MRYQDRILELELEGFMAPIDVTLSQYQLRSVAESNRGLLVEETHLQNR